jgi:hypothetical protein
MLKGLTMAKVKMNFKTPLCELMWVSIDGKGKLKYDPNGMLDENDPQNYHYTATARLTKEQADSIKKALQEFWRNNKPQGATKQKYDIVKPELEKVLDEQGKEVLDEDGAPVMKETGYYVMQFKTKTVWPDGKPNKVKVLRANGTPIDLGDTKIGNGSTGVIHGNIMINSFKGNEGLLANLQAIQLKKLVPYAEDDVEAEDLGDDEGLEDVAMQKYDSLDEGDKPEV